ncbi:MAG TPA: YHYH protein [Tepidisphaeraceae bacterium]|nr:YHYH protein [Tepidisphaeraceae bacterium]
MRFIENWRLNVCVVGYILLTAMALAEGQTVNLVRNSTFDQRNNSNTGPADYRLSGSVEYRYLGDPRRDVSGWGVALQSAGPGSPSGSVGQTITGIDSKAGRLFRFSFRGLPQDDFAVNDNDLSMRVEFFANGGRMPMDAKGVQIYPIIQLARRNLNVNGDRHVGGAAVWQTYSMVFWLPFPQVDTLRLSVVFGHGAAQRPVASEFFMNDWSLVRLAMPAAAPDSSKPPAAHQPRGKPISLGGRWYYDSMPDRPSPPRVFNFSNADRLLYFDGQWETPFAGEMSSWLRAGDMDLQGHVVSVDQPVPDNVTVRFDGTSMVIHTKGLPNHPTGRFPELTPFGNPNYIQEQDATYYIPLNPKVNPEHFATTSDNSNHALPMGPIGIAVNGVVFFNPFDANSQDASNLMDRCCGHPSPDNVYHYHKYPICLNSPWSDDGSAHSPIIGWAFDGFPIYGPYASAGVMAKDATGAYALNDFNMHWDKDRGWHYQVTPGKFPYIIGGYWGYVDRRDVGRGHAGHGMGPPNRPIPAGGGMDQRVFGPPPDGMGPPPGGPDGMPPQ